MGTLARIRPSKLVVHLASCLASVDPNGGHGPRQGASLNGSFLARSKKLIRDLAGAALGILRRPHLPWVHLHILRSEILPCGR